MGNDGKKYEQFVKDLQQALMNSEDIVKQKNIRIETNKKLQDNCGIEREFDLYWEYELAGVVYKTVIECKDYQSRISVEKIDALIGKIRDLPDLKALFATKTGYQKGAKKKAEFNKIDLLVVREGSDEDWQDSEGNPYMKNLEIHMKLIPPARIIHFKQFIDANWAKENTDLDIEKPFGQYPRNDQITIEDLEKGEKYTIRDIEVSLASLHTDESGKFSKIEEFKNAYIHYDGLKLKLRGYKIDYSVSSPMQTSTSALMHK